ncbi:putative membrane protein [Psychrobacillus sp. OK032]|nr:putative membrane protein [Psychrobacillus sp. OK032]
MHTHNHSNEISYLAQIILATPFVLALIFYLIAVTVSNRKKKQWPFYRVILWIIGVVCASLAVIGPIADRSHEDFSAHMVGHLLLGMLAPLLMALAAPMTLVLRSRAVNILHNSIFTSILNVGVMVALHNGTIRYDA